MDKVFINSSKIECKDNSGNITFSSNFNYLKTNSASKTEISGIALTRVPQGVSTDSQGFVSSKQVGNMNFISATPNSGALLVLNQSMSIQFYFSNFHPVSIMGFIGNKQILPQFQTDQSISSTKHALIQQFVNGSWVTRYESLLNSFSSYFAPQGTPQAFNRFFYVPDWDNVAIINNLISTHGGGNYRFFINSNWNVGMTPANTTYLEFAMANYQQSGGARLINAEITP